MIKKVPAKDSWKIEVSSTDTGKNSLQDRAGLFRPVPTMIAAPDTMPQLIRASIDNLFITIF